MQGTRDGWLLLALAALLAVVAATSGGSVRRRLRGTLLRAAAVLIGGASLAGLAGLVWLAQAGPDSVRATIRGAWQDIQAPSAPLPRVHHPTPRPSAGAPRPAPASGRLDGIVTRVRDGDTIVVAGTPIRFADVDCAEAGTPAGDRATAALRTLAAGRAVRCHLIGRRSYDREIGRCALEDGRDLGLALVRAGLCTMRRP